MNAQELLAESQTFFVNSGLGVSKTIKYVHDDGTIIPELKVFANEIDINKVKKDKSSAIATLANVYLSQKPVQGDRVQFSGETDVWRVQSWRPQDGAYILEITSKRYKTT